MDLLRKLVDTPGAAGREERIRAVVADEVAGLFDAVETDPMGNLICTREPRPPVRRGKSKAAAPRQPLTVMIAGHMDEIGFYVSYVDDKTGFLRVQNVGGFDMRTLLARRVLVQTAGGDLAGVMSAARPTHVMTDEERKKIPEMTDVYVDLMLDPKKVARKVRVGDPVTLWSPLTEIGDAYVAKAFDNRLAIWVAISAIRKLKHHRCRVVFAATVQEEVGLRGAVTSAYAVKPDVGIAIDSTIAADTPGVADHQRVTVWGGGVALKVMDSMSITDRPLLDEWIAIAERKKIKYQLEVLPRGGTDAGAVQRAAAGCRAGTISIPIRYVHTVTEAVHKKDLAASVSLLAAYLQGA